MFKLRLNWLKHWILFQPLSCSVTKCFKLELPHSSAWLVVEEPEITEASRWVNCRSPIPGEISGYFLRLCSEAWISSSYCNWMYPFIRFPKMHTSLKHPRHSTEGNVFNTCREYVQVSMVSWSGGKKKLSHTQVSLSRWGPPYLFAPLGIVVGWTCEFCLSEV